MMLSSILKSTGTFLLLITAVVNAAQNSTSQTTSNLNQEQSLIKQGHLDEARALILADLNKQPSVEAFNLLGIIDTEAQDYPGALDALSSALQLAPNSVQTHNNLGNVYLSNKKTDLAEREFRTVLRFNPTNQNATYNLGVLLMAKGYPAEAIRYFGRIHPQNIEARFGLIRAYIQTKRISEALRLATQISEEKKDDVNVHVSLGILLASENQFKAAQFEFEQAEALQPNTFNILYNLGQASFRTGDNHDAELALSQALKLEPTSSETLYLLAEVYTDESRQLDALDFLVRANKLAPTNPDILYLMAKISISQQYYEDAIPLLEKALQIAPARPDLLALLGECYFKSGKTDKSIAVFAQIVSIQPSVRAYAFLGLAHTTMASNWIPIASSVFSSWVTLLECKGTR
jgi:tetratricopeptide (TPR) repeat protein